jgi:hypothetical protein
VTTSEGKAEKNLSRLDWPTAVLAFFDLGVEGDEVGVRFDIAWGNNGDNAETMTRTSKFGANAAGTTLTFFLPPHTYT